MFHVPLASGLMCLNSLDTVVFVNSGEAGDFFSAGVCGDVPEFSDAFPKPLQIFPGHFEVLHIITGIDVCSSQQAESLFFQFFCLGKYRY